MAHRVGWFHRPLDVDAMAAAAGLLLGDHDFSAFRSVECQAKSPVKTLRRADVTMHGDLLVFEFEASAFLASHGAQSRRHAGVCGQGRTSAGVGRRQSWRAATAPAPHQPSKLAGCTLPGWIMIWHGN
jgi:hypothetical protein